MLAKSMIEKVLKISDLEKRHSYYLYIAKDSYTVCMYKYKYKYIHY